MKYMDTATIRRVILFLIGQLNIILVAVGANPISISDNILYIIASVIFMLVTAIHAVYKNNPTSKLGSLWRVLKDRADIYGVDEIFDDIIELMQDRYPTDPADDEVLPE